MKVKEIMNTDVKTIATGKSIQEAARIMNEFSIGCLMVVKGGLLKGIITERDIMRKVVEKALVSSKVPVEDVMTKRVIMIDPDKDVEEASRIMIENKIKKLPVLYKGSLVGIVTATDIVTAHPNIYEKVGELLTISQKKSVAG